MINNGVFCYFDCIIKRQFDIRFVTDFGNVYVFYAVSVISKAMFNFIILMKWFIRSIQLVLNKLSL